jgi:hypothetical protein
MTRGGQTGLAPAVGSGWAVRPAQSKASVSIATERITAARMLEIALLAARRVDDSKARIQLGERSTSRTEFIVRDLVKGEDAELMRFEVLVERAAGRTTARTQILSYQTKDAGIGTLVPVVHRKLAGFSAYEAFMNTYGALSQAEDRGAWVSHNSGK